MNKSRILGILAGASFSVVTLGSASAQYWRQDELGFIEPRFRGGSAVCPEGYDYDRGRCKPQGYYGQGQRGGYYGERRRMRDSVPPRFNRRGSAVCPEGYDYYDQEGLCLSR